MSTTTKNKNCCQGCKNGQPGQNKTCQAKIVLEKIQQQQTLLKQDKL